MDTRVVTVRRACFWSAVACFVALVISGAQTGQGATPCANTPRNGNGDNRLEALCKAIHQVAEGAQEITVAYREDASAPVVETKLWRNETGTAIDIDFGGQWIGASILARLLSGATFVPVDRVDLVVLRNALVRGTLDLSNATIEVAARFDDAVLNPEEDGSCATDPQADSYALKLVGTHAKKRISLVRTQACGSVLLSGSRLDGGIEFSGRGVGSAHAIDGPSVLSQIFIVKSTIQSDLLFRSTRIAQDAQIERSDVTSITMVDADFNGPLLVADNAIGSLSAWNTSFHDRIRIVNNRVQAELKMAVVTFAGSAPVIRDNAVDGNLQITIRQLEDGTVVDLPHNQVDRAGEIWLPEGWRGVLNLDNSLFESVLKLCTAAYDPEERTLMPRPANVAGEAVLKDCPAAAPGGVGNPAKARLARTAGADQRTDRTVVSLRSTDVGTLAWRLPLDCSFRWNGTGLRYKNWAESNGYDPALSAYECPELVRETTGQSIRPTEGLMLMRYLMIEQDVDALDAMADYLESRGRVVESRDVRQEAKKANYVNIPEQAGYFDRWSRALASVVLRPVGYGAKPELALIWLGALWLISYVIYEIYSLALRRSWHEEIKAGGDIVTGYSYVPGFKQFDKEKDPKEFEIIRYSIDAMLPVINLHTYDHYYTRSRALRVYAGVQHAVGWFLITIFLVSAAIL